MSCQSLYLDPRPTLSTVGVAYAKYYTHGSGKSVSFVHMLKARLRNECLSQKLSVNIEPRLHLPKLLGAFIDLIGKRVAVPFGWALLASHPKGRFMDVGCGAGVAVAMARQLGWDAMGIEIDSAAVLEAQRTSLTIVQGTYEKLKQYECQFDCVMCSHVLEHVHDPLDLLAHLKKAIKPGGVLLLTLPNSLSPMRHHFGANWRGIEAPRHLSIPSELRLLELLVESGFSIQSLSDSGLETASESYRIQRRGLALNSKDIAMARQLDARLLATVAENDFIQFICKSSAVLTPEI
jgi:2-polyprenyl-3-methyl-5-hydroxy-6-metoxy-1,4-benzoquinol methylase